MRDYPARRLKVGTMQAALHTDSDGLETYRVQRWNGRTWDWVEDLPITVVIPFNLCRHFASKAVADAALQKSGVPWRK